MLDPCAAAGSPADTEAQVTPPSFVTKIVEASPEQGKKVMNWKHAVDVKCSEHNKRINIISAEQNEEYGIEINSEPAAIAYVLLELDTHWRSWVDEVLEAAQLVP